MIILWIGDKEAYKHLIPETVWFGFKYCLSMIRSIGGIAFLIIYIQHGGTFPNIGIILIFVGFLNSSYPFDHSKGENGSIPLQNLSGSTGSDLRENPSNSNDSHRHSRTKIVYLNLCRMAHFISGVGLGLYIVAGALQIAHKGFNIATITLDIAQGCPNGTFFTLVELCSNPAPYEYSILTDDDASQISFWFLGSLIGLLSCGSVIPTLYDPTWFLKRQENFKSIAFPITAVGVFLAIGGAAGATQSYSTEYYNCENIKQQSDGNWTGCVSESLNWGSSGSGFWDIWTQFTVVVLEGIFAW